MFETCKTFRNPNPITVTIGITEQGFCSAGESVATIAVAPYTMVRCEIEVTKLDEAGRLI